MGRRADPGSRPPARLGRGSGPRPPEQRSPACGRRPAADRSRFRARPRPRAEPPCATRAARSSGGRSSRPPKSARAGRRGAERSGRVCRIALPGRPIAPSTTRSWPPAVLPWRTVYRTCESASGVVLRSMMTVNGCPQSTCSKRPAGAGRRERRDRVRPWHAGQLGHGERGQHIAGVVGARQRAG